MSAADVELVRRCLKLWIANERDSAWEMWSPDAVANVDERWPEPGPYEGRDAVRALFDSWDSAFGSDWPTRMRLDGVRDAGAGRVLLEFGFEPTGAGSGVPLLQDLAAIYRVADEAIVEADFFTDVAEARRAAGVD